MSKRLISIAFILITIMLALNIFFTYRNSEVLEKNRLLQQQTEEIKEALSNIAIIIIHNLDLGIRSYALFNDEKYLYPFHLALKESDSILNFTEALLSLQDYPLAEFYQLKDSINAYSSLNSKLKELIDSGRLNEFHQLANQDKGYLLWLQYEKFADHVNAFENSIHAQATINYENALRNNYLIQFFLFLICIPTLLFTTFHINRTIALEAKLKVAETDRANLLLTQNELLESKVLERTEEIQKKNLELLKKHEEIAVKNKKLNEAQQMILQQHEEIKGKNELLNIEVAKKTKELVSYNQQLEQFAFAAAHNLRAPVARILGLGKILNYTSVNEEEKRYIIKNIIASIVNLDTVIKDLNTILEIKTNINSQLTEVNYHEELKFIKSNLEKEIEESQCEILEYFQEVPSIISVKAYIDSILFNLISNALKYRSPHRKLCITLRTYHEGKFTCLEVQDNGVGIDLEKHGNDVFALYKRFNTQTEGKGLGLYLVKMQAISLGGRVEVKSVPDQGSTFKVYFKKY